MIISCEGPFWSISGQHFKGDVCAINGKVAYECNIV